MLLSNPTEARLLECVDMMRKQTWKFIPMLEAHCEVEFTLDECVRRIRGELIMNSLHGGEREREGTKMSRTRSWDPDQFHLFNESLEMSKQRKERRERERDEREEEEEEEREKERKRSPYGILREDADESDLKREKKMKKKKGGERGGERERKKMGNDEDMRRIYSHPNLKGAVQVGKTDRDTRKHSPYNDVSNLKSTDHSLYSNTSESGGHHSPLVLEEEDVMDDHMLQHYKQSHISNSDSGIILEHSHPRGDDIPITVIARQQTDSADYKPQRGMTEFVVPPYRLPKPRALDLESLISGGDEKEREREDEKEKDRDNEKERERENENEKEKESDTEREKERERERERDSYSPRSPLSSSTGSRRGSGDLRADLIFKSTNEVSPRRVVLPASQSKERRRNTMNLNE